MVNIPGEPGAPSVPGQSMTAGKSPLAQIDLSKLPMGTPPEAEAAIRQAQAQTSSQPAGALAPPAPAITTPTPSTAKTGLAAVDITKLPMGTPPEAEAAIRQAQAQAQVQGPTQAPVTAAVQAARTQSPQPSTQAPVGPTPAVDITKLPMGTPIEAERAVRPKPPPAFGSPEYVEWYYNDPSGPGYKPGSSKTVVVERSTGAVYVVDTKTGEARATGTTASEPEWNAIQKLNELGQGLYSKDFDATKADLIQLAGIVRSAGPGAAAYINTLYGEKGVARVQELVHYLDQIGNAGSKILGKTFDPANATVAELAEIYRQDKSVEAAYKAIYGPEGFKQIQDHVRVVQAIHDAQAFVRLYATREGVAVNDWVALLSKGLDPKVLKAAYPGNEATIDAAAATLQTLRADPRRTYVRSDGSIDVLNALADKVVTPQQLESLGYDKSSIDNISKLLSIGALSQDINGNWRVDPYKAYLQPSISTDKGSTYTESLLKEAGFTEEQLSEIKKALAEMPGAHKAVVAREGITGLEKRGLAGNLPYSTVQRDQYGVAVGQTVIYALRHPTQALQDMSTLTQNIQTKLANYLQPITTPETGATVRALATAGLTLATGTLAVVPITGQILGLDGLKGVGQGFKSLITMPASTVESIYKAFVPGPGWSPEAAGAGIAGLVNVALVVDPAKSLGVKLATYLSPRGLTPGLIGREANTGRIPLGKYDPVELGKAVTEASKAALVADGKTLVKVPIGDTGDYLLVNKTPFQAAVGNISFHGSTEGLEFIRQQGKTFTVGEAGLYTNPWAALDYAKGPNGAVLAVITDPSLVKTAPTQVLASVSQSDAFIREASEGLWGNNKLWRRDFETELIYAPESKIEIPPPNADLLTRLQAGTYADYVVAYQGRFVPVKLGIDKGLLEKGLLPHPPTPADLYLIKLMVARDALQNAYLALTHPEATLADLVRMAASAIKHPEEVLRGMTSPSMDLSLPGVRDVYLETGLISRIRTAFASMWRDISAEAKRSGATPGTAEWERAIAREAERYYAQQIGSLTRNYSSVARAYTTDPDFRRKFEALYMTSLSLHLESVVRSARTATDVITTAFRADDVRTVRTTLSPEEMRILRESVREYQSSRAEPRSEIVESRALSEEQRRSVEGRREELREYRPELREERRDERREEQHREEPREGYREEHREDHKEDHQGYLYTRLSPSQKDQQEKNLREAFRGGTAWKQGIVYWVGKPPYKTIDDWHAFHKKNLPPEVRIVSGGPKSAYRSIQAMGYEVPENLTLKLGFQKITIRSPSTEPGKEGAIEYSPVKLEPAPADVVLKYRPSLRQGTDLRYPGSFRDPKAFRQQLVRGLELPTTSSDQAQLAVTRAYQTRAGVPARSETLPEHAQRALPEQARQILPEQAKAPRALELLETPPTEPTTTEDLIVIPKLPGEFRMGTDVRYPGSFRDPESFRERTRPRAGSNSDTFQNWLWGNLAEEPIGFKAPRTQQSRTKKRVARKRDLPQSGFFSPKLF